MTNVLSWGHSGAERRDASLDAVHMNVEKSLTGTSEVATTADTSKAASAVAAATAAAAADFDRILSKSSVQMDQKVMRNPDFPTILESWTTAGFVEHLFDEFADGRYLQEKHLQELMNAVTYAARSGSADIDDGNFKQWWERNKAKAQDTFPPDRVKEGIKQYGQSGRGLTREGFMDFMINVLNSAAAQQAKARVAPVVGEHAVGENPRSTLVSL
eukprot:TRINITY_DN8673_c0_g1_i1.p1 TRINITY_DN8673_c0_g1~~TRINITY_DN8673_c0_g1_i1.p1  ORF type:complete len:215 (+),score=28.18 TRINITY_DN8673_c0_g1_i1:158-802(+)